MGFNSGFKGLNWRIVVVRCTCRLVNVCVQWPSELLWPAQEGLCSWWWFLSVSRGGRTFLKHSPPQLLCPLRPFLFLQLIKRSLVLLYLFVFDRSSYTIQVRTSLSSRLLSKTVKTNIWWTVILSAVLYGCETWSLTLREDRRLRVFEQISALLYRHWGSVQAVRPIRGVEVYIYSFMTTALEWGEGSASRPGRSIPPGKTRYPLYRRLGGPQGRSGQMRKISLPPGFDPRTVQPVASPNSAEKDI